MKGAFAAGIAANVSFSTGVWVMHPRTALYLSMLLTTGHHRACPEINVRGGMWFGLPVIVSANVPVDTGEDSYVALIDAQEVFLAEDTVVLDMSRNASLEMADDPRGGAQTLVSLWQANLIAIRAERFLNWGRRNEAGVAYILGVEY